MSRPLTPDEWRDRFVEPGVQKRQEDGAVLSVAIDLRRAHTYGGNGITFMPDGVGKDATLILSADAIRRLARLVDPPR